jgi:hypothetical protein
MKRSIIHVDRRYANDHFIPLPLSNTILFFPLILLAGSSLSSAQEEDSIAQADSLLMQELEQALGKMTQTDPTSSATPPPRSTSSSNPDISVIGDLRAWYLSEGERNLDGGFHEAEFTFKSFIDPYARADFFVAAHNENGKVGFELEEAYLTTMSLPHRLQLKAGKFRSIFGKINLIHPHALPFPDVPALYVNYFGEEGLNDEGASLSWLLPNPSFFQELTLEVTRGPGESELFATSEENKFLYVGHLKNFWDLTDNTTLEMGLSGTTGPNAAGLTTRLGGLDLTYQVETQAVQHLYLPHGTKRSFFQ